MKTLVFSIGIVLFVAVFQNSSIEFYPEKQALKSVKSALKEKDVLLVEQLEVISDVLKEEPMTIYCFEKAGGEKIYAVFAQACGRHDNFDYLMIADVNYSIEKVKVLKYRSEHGGEIASKRWLRQFENYSSGELRYKKEISALSGATISANALVADIPKVLKILKESVEN